LPSHDSKQEESLPSSSEVSIKINEPGSKIVPKETEANQNSNNIFWIVLNVFSSVSLVMINKWIFEFEGFRYGALLTLIHFIMTTIGMEICAYLRVFEVKVLTYRSILPLSLTFCGFVVLTNLSLKYNSVGFYQLTKVLTTPTVVFIQMVFYAMTFPLNIKLSLIVILIGVSIGTVTDVQFNLIGTLIAIVGVVVTSLYQIWVNTKQKQLQADSMQLLYYQARLSCLFLLVSFPFIDNAFFELHTVYENSTFSQTAWILISAVLAFFVNISTYFVIGGTSPVTYNVVGHFKTCCVLFGGFLLFQYPIDLRNIGGIVCTIVGIILYTYFKLGPQK